MHRVMKYCMFLIPLRGAIDSDARIGFLLLDPVNVTDVGKTLCVCALS